MKAIAKLLKPLNFIFWLHNEIGINISANEGKGLFRTTADRTTEAWSSIVNR